jgi:hypothetical protein
MSTDLSKENVTARMIFTGVMLGCINDDDHYEVGMIKCPEHNPRIDIQHKVAGQNVTKYLVWPEGHDLIFRVVNPQEEGVSKHLPAEDEHQRSFNFVVDVEGAKLHAGGVTIDTAAFNGRRIGVTAGKLYAHQLTGEANLKTWNDANDLGTVVESFGRIANKIGLNIKCAEGDDNGIEILDAATGQRLHWMAALPGISYTIDVNNDCHRALPPPPQPAVNLAADDAEANSPAAPPPKPPGTDFRQYYSVIRPSDPEDNRKFDFELKVLPGLAPTPSPDICNGSHGGGNKSIGLDWSAI